MRDFNPHGYQHLMLGPMTDLLRLNAFCFMGSGKTVTALTALNALSLTEDCFPALVLAPLRVARDTWATETAKWRHLCGLRCSAIIGTPAERLAALQRPAEVYTLNYENLPWLFETLGGRWPFPTVVADESTRLKSFRIKQGGTRAAGFRPIAHKKVRRWINLTGTPAPNGLACLWGQNWFVDGGKRLGATFSAFEARWFAPNRGGYGIRPLGHAAEQIHALLADCSVSLDPHDWFDFKDPVVLPVVVKLNNKARAIYDEMEQELFIELASDVPVEAFNEAGCSNKCLQIANGAVYDNELRKAWHVVHDEKLAALESIMEENAGDSLLVSYTFKPDRARILKAFPKVLDLAVGENLKRFKTERGLVGLAHPKSMGHGIDGMQQHCHKLVHFGHGWNAEERDQIEGRIAPVRQIQYGLDRPVYHYNIIAEDTIDEVVIARQASKAKVQDALTAYMNLKKARRA